MRPPTPVPFSELRSMLFSAASFRTRGVTYGALLEPTAGAGSAAGAGAACGAGAGSGQLAADRNRDVLFGGDADQRARDRRRDLGVDLVGGNLDEGLVHVDRVADLLEPASDGAFGDGLAEFGHQHRLRV